MNIEYKDYITSFNELYETSWSGAISTLDKIREEQKEEELIELLTIVFDKEIPPTRTEINDFLWFDTEFIYANLDIEED